MRQYVVDAFTKEVFRGNPAAVCVMESWLPDETMQRIACENNLSETAFAVREGELYHLRWFTPAGEIDLCGHATLATAYVILRFLSPALAEIRFSTLSGILSVKKAGDRLTIELPAYTLRPVGVTSLMAEVIGAKPAEAYIGRDLLCVLENEADVRNADPDLTKMLELDGQLLHITAKGKAFDCVSRSFAPKCGVPEDPVCGSGHCHIIPYWAEKLRKEELVAYQASKRGGTLYCRMAGDRVLLSGEAALYAISEIYID